MHHFKGQSYKYALIDLDNGQKIRVAKKYFNHWGYGAIDRLVPGDRLTLVRMTFSTKFQHYGWNILELPTRIIISADSEGNDLTALHEPNAPKDWAEHDEDFENGVIVAGRITEIKKMYRSKFLYMMVELTDGRLTCVNRRAFIGSRFKPRDFAVGDVLTLRKGGFSHSAQLNNWVLYGKVG